MKIRKSMKPYGSFFMLVLVSMSTILTSACGRNEKNLQPAGEYQIGLTVSPDPPAVGPNTFKIRLEDRNGKPVNDATVHIHNSMPAMAGMPAMSNEAVASPKGNGWYEASIDLGSGGQFPWDVQIEVVRAQKVLAQARWQVTPGTKGIKFIAAESSSSDGEKVDYYTCTMHP